MCDQVGGSRSESARPSPTPGTKDTAKETPRDVKDSGKEAKAASSGKSQLCVPKVYSSKMATTLVFPVTTAGFNVENSLLLIIYMREMWRRR